MATRTDRFMSAAVRAARQAKDWALTAAREADRLLQEARKRAEGLIGGITGGATQPSTQPATKPADRIQQEAGKAVEKGITDLFNRDKKKK